MPALKYVLAALACVGLGIAASELQDAATIDSGVALAGAVLLVTACSVYLMRDLREDPVHAPALYGLATLVYLGPVSLVWLGTPQGAGPRLDQRDVTEALLLTTAALVAFIAGTRMVRARPRQARMPMAPGEAPSPAVLAIFFFGVSLVLVLALSRGQFGYLADPTQTAGSLGQGLSLLAGSGTIVVIATAVAAFQTDSRALRRMLMLFLLVTIPLGLVVGVKSFILEAFLSVGLAFVMAKGKIPWRPVLAVTFLALFVLVPLNDAYRRALRIEGEQQVSGALAKAVQNRPQDGFAVAVEDSYLYATTRLRSIDNVALILDRTPGSYPFEGREKYLLLPLLPIVPRSLWPEKPILNDSALFSQSYWEIPEFISTSTPLTQIGGLYRAFGLAGAILGMLLWGMVISAIYAFFRRFQSPRLELVYIWALIRVVTYVESDLPALATTGFQTLVTAYMVAWLLLPGRDSPAGYRTLIGMAASRRASRAPVAPA
jgi:hypothetical protein